MSKNPPQVQLQLNPSLFDATGRASAKVVTAPPLFDPFGDDEPMSGLDYDRWLDRLDRAREFAADARG